MFTCPAIFDLTPAQKPATTTRNDDRSRIIQSSHSNGGHTTVITSSLSEVPKTDDVRANENFRIIHAGVHLITAVYLTIT